MLSILKTKFMHNWEKFVFAILLILLAIQTFSFIMSLHADTNMSMNEMGKLPDTSSILNSNAFRFLNDCKPLDNAENPFRAIRKKVKKNVQKTKNKKNVSTKTKDGKTIVVKKKKAPRPKPKVFRVIEYIGWITSDNGESMIMFNVIDPKRKSVRSKLLPSSAGKILGLKVEKCDSKSIVVIDAAGKKNSIPIHKRQKIHIK